MQLIRSNGIDQQNLRPMSPRAGAAGSRGPSPSHREETSQSATSIVPPPIAIGDEQTSGSGEGASANEDLVKYWLNMLNKNPKAADEISLSMTNEVKDGEVIEAVFKLWEKRSNQAVTFEPGSPELPEHRYLETQDDEEMYDLLVDCYAEKPISTHSISAGAASRRDLEPSDFDEEYPLGLGIEQTSGSGEGASANEDLVKYWYNKIVKGPEDKQQDIVESMLNKCVDENVTGEVVRRLAERPRQAVTVKTDSAASTELPDCGALDDSWVDCYAEKPISTHNISAGAASRRDLEPSDFHEAYPLGLGIEQASISGEGAKVNENPVEYWYSRFLTDVKTDVNSHDKIVEDMCSQGVSQNIIDEFIKSVEEHFKYNFGIRETSTRAKVSPVSPEKKIMVLSSPKNFYSYDEVMPAVKRNGLILEFASKELQNNKNMVMAAVSNDGMALKFASERLRDDEEIVTIAIAKNGMALQFASERCRNNKSIVKLAVEKNGSAY